ncbi:hypothetical protein Tco_0970380 [Tanacetum coccineum]
MDREVKTLKRSKIPIVKVRWNSERGPEFTWEREDHMNAIVETNVFSILTPFVMTMPIDHALRFRLGKKQKPRKSKKQNTEVSQPSDSTKPIVDEAPTDENVTTYSNDPLLSGEEKLKLNELMELCINLSQRVLDLENIKTSQAAEITKLKERVKMLERRNKSRTPGLKRLRKVGRIARIESSKDEGLGDQEDASKQGRKIADIDADEEVTLIDETQGRNDDNLMFDTGVLDEQEVEVEKVVSTAEVTTASATTTTVDELTLAQTLIEIKAAKPKAVTTAATTTTTAVTRPKARGVVVQEPSEFTTTTSPSQPSQLPQAKDKGKAKMVEPEKPLKKKDQILIDEEIAQRLQEELQAELEEEERLARQKEEDANIAEWDNVQAMIDADYELAARLQAQEQEELTIEERSKMFVELMDKRKKHFARLRAEEQRRKPPTKAQKRREELESDNSKKQKLDKNLEAKVDDKAEIKKHLELVPDDEVAIYVIPLATKPPIIVEWKIIKERKMGYFQIIRANGSLRRPEEAYERVLWGDLKVMFEPNIEKKKYLLTPATITKMLNKKLQADHWNEMCYQLLKLMKKQLKNPESGRIVGIKKLHDNLEVNTAKMKKHMKIVPDDEVAIDAIPLATKPPIIMLQNIDKEDLETLWKLVKAKHGNTRPEEAYERVLWDDLKVMFKPDIESEVWRNLQGYKVTIRKLFSSSGVYFVRFQNLYIFMLVEKKYPHSLVTITKMLNKKL